MVEGKVIEKWTKKLRILGLMPLIYEHKFSEPPLESQALKPLKYYLWWFPTSKLEHSETKDYLAESEWRIKVVIAKQTH